MRRLLALSALLVTCASTEVVRAEVVYTPLDVRVTLWEVGFHDLTLPVPGAPRFGVRSWSMEGGFHTNLFLQVESLDGLGGVVVNEFEGLAEGTSIGPASHFEPGGDFLIVSFNHFGQVDYFAGAFFIGLRFMIADHTHYGWLSVNPDPPEDPGMNARVGALHGLTSDGSS
ncbi:MAG: hypothetical protein KF691_10440 [Phycisphaeraceae bacterium]|nr:hypothetical protein [Phycisphaeraceae bacterium]